MRSLVVSLAFLALVACDDDDDGGGGGSFNSGVDGEKELSELTDEEANQICRAAEAYGEGLFSRAEACAIAALLFSEDQASCNQLATACEQAPPEPDDDEDSCQDGVPPQLEDCSATVAEMEACQIGLANTVRQSVAGLGCGQAGDAAAQERATAVFSAGDPATVPACDAVRTKCPAAFGGAANGDAGVGGGMDGIDAADAGPS